MSRTVSNELDPLVNQFQHLSEKRRAPEALERLKKVASMVKPIMRQRNWRVGTLAEFYPSEANLLGLNVNQGEKICLRLRYPGDETQFLPIENVVDTMLHELAHNVIGPHNQEFHALWDKLRDEHEALVRKGYTGEGFLGRGNRLGGQRIPLSEVRRQARAAAERRKALTAGSGQRLGGAGILRGQNAREIIAAAAEKRMKIERGCASDTDKGRKIAREEELKKDKVTTTQAEKEDETEAAIMQAYIDLIQEEEREQFGKDYVPPSQSNPAGVRGTMSPSGTGPSWIPTMSPNSLIEQQAQIEEELQKGRAPSSASLPQTDATTASSPIPMIRNRPSPPKTQIEPKPDTWTCEICTLINPIQYLSCDACATERPAIYSQPDRPSPPPLPSSRPRGPPTRSGASRPRAQSHSRETPNSLKPRLSVVDSLAKLDAQGAYKKNLPIGWQCSQCNNWMEQEWWTCSVCGRMKASS